MGYLRAIPCRQVQNSSMVPQGQFHPPPLVARGKIYPRAVRNGSLRREGAAETTSGVPARETRFRKSCAFAPNGVGGRPE